MELLYWSGLLWSQMVETTPRTTLGWMSKWTRNGIYCPCDKEVHRELVSAIAVSRGTECQRARFAHSAPRLCFLQCWLQDQANFPLVLAGWLPAASESYSPATPAEIEILFLNHWKSPNWDVPEYHVSLHPGQKRWDSLARASIVVRQLGSSDCGNRWVPFNSPRLLPDIQDPS